MFDNKLWHHALKLNKGIYKTTEHLSDAEILKKQLREQTNEILSTISVYYSRSVSVEVVPPLGGLTSKHSSPVSAGSFDLHSALSFFPSASALPPQDSKFSAKGGSASGGKIQNSKFKSHDHSLPASVSNVNGQMSNVNYYLPESEICLLLLLDKITVLKTFLFLAKEHNFFNEEKHQILTAACVHLSDSVQSELHGADIFSHPIFNSVSVDVPPGGTEVAPLSLREIPRSGTEVRPPDINSASTPSVFASPPAAAVDEAISPSAFPSASVEVVPPSLGGPTSKHSLSASPEDETLSDILDNLSDIIHENTENISDNLSDISVEVVPPLEVSPFGRSPAGRRPPKIDSALSDNLSDTPNKKAENYISKSIKSRQNKSFKSYFPKFLNRPSFSPEVAPPPTSKHSLSASPEVVPPPGFGGPTSEYSPSAFAEIPQNAPSSIAIEESPQFDFLAIYSAPAYSIFTPSANVPPGGTEVVPPLGFGGPTSKHSPSTSSDLVRHLTPRQQKLHDFIVAKSASPEVAPLSFREIPRSGTGGPTSKHSLSASASASNVKIGDLTPLFPEKISEKTIRRDLQVLVNNSLIAQSGSRRWTCYSVV